VGEKRRNHHTGHAKRPPRRGTVSHPHRRMLRRDAAHRVGVQPHALRGDVAAAGRDEQGWRTRPRGGRAQRFALVERRHPFSWARHAVDRTVARLRPGAPDVDAAILQAVASTEPSSLAPRRDGRIARHVAQRLRVPVGRRASSTFTAGPPPSAAASYLRRPALRSDQRRRRPAACRRRTLPDGLPREQVIPTADHRPAAATSRPRVPMAVRLRRPAWRRVTFTWPGCSASALATLGARGHRAAPPARRAAASSLAASAG
jgi:hypothetical protein